VASLRLRALEWRAAGLEYRLDLTVDGGEFVAVAAEAGAGERLADVLLGLARPTSGSVCLDERDVTDLPPGERGIALVPAGGGLLPHLRVRRNIAYGGDPAYADDRIRELQLESVRSRHPHELSPAQRLQVAVARAFCRDPAPAAVVVEDRTGEAPCEPAVEAAGMLGAAVLVIGERERRSGVVPVGAP
jgi:ABC-type thiamine transport system ATPase subunit